MITLDLFCRPFDPADAEMMRVGGIESTESTHVAGLLKLGPDGPQEIVVGAYNRFGAFEPLPVGACEKVAPGFADIWPQLVTIHTALREILDEGKEDIDDRETQEADSAGG